jgi:hypothetical protein
MLLSTVRAFPPFLDVLQCFGRRNDDDATPVPPYQEHIRRDIGFQGKTSAKLLEVTLAKL